MKNSNKKTTLQTVPTDKEFQEYEDGPKEIAGLINHFTPLQLHYKMNEDEWSINHIAIHLADTEIIFCERLKRIIAEEKPDLQSFEQDDWAKNLLYEKQDSRFAIGLLIALRRSTAPLLRLLAVNNWSRQGVREDKIVTLYDIFSIALHHISSHKKQISKITNSPHFPS